MVGLGRNSIYVLCILLWLNQGWSARGASHQPASIDSCLTISHTCLPCLPSRWVSPGCTFWFVHRAVFVLWRVGAILGNGYRVQGQNYVSNVSMEWEISKVSLQEFDVYCIILSDKLGADILVAWLAANQNSNSAIRGSLPKRRKHGHILWLWYGEPSVKNQWGTDERLNFVRRQLFCEIVK